MLAYGARLHLSGCEALACVTRRFDSSIEALHRGVPDTSLCHQGIRSHGEGDSSESPRPDGVVSVGRIRLTRGLLVGGKTAREDNGR